MIIKEPRHPEEGEYSISTLGVLVVFRDGRWVVP